MSKALMIQGTGSDVGKSLMVAGLCRAYARRGISVQPFKPQNMSNNAAVTPGGGEIGRAQALQAKAAGVSPTVHMNPVLLKPQSDIGAQVVVQGRAEGTVKARDYHALKPKLLAKVLESFAIVAHDADLVLVEGAGSPAEVNLRDGDIANMGFAEAANVPVVLVADIERGGVIASLIGTYDLLSDTEKTLMKGYIVNKFRGDAGLFADALATIKGKTGLDCFGIVPFFNAARLLPKEDALSLDNRDDGGENGAIKIAALRLSRIANFDDLDPLAAEPDVAVSIIEPGTPLPGDTDMVIIPGSKSTLADLAAIRAEGWDVDIAAHVRRGGMVVGLCGGYQILGGHIADPDGIEGLVSEAEGLALLDVQTIIGGDKTLTETAGTEIASSAPVKGYEMHMGDTTGAGLENPWLTLEEGRPEGAISADGKILGTYVHGLFASDDFRHAFLARLGGKGTVAYEAQVEETLDALADHLEEHLDLDGLLAAAAPAAN
ncbi:MAG: cobyric acid synthase [Proteobacteria bacterium]|nr:cobyric acid synthase [Pseudomonadota bacterium]MDA1022036.1 cobyric acid synthase [Pseudomonadota bacterium]